MENYKLKKYIQICLKIYIKTKKIITKFGDIESEKQKLNQHKRPISIKNTDINKIAISNKISFSK